MADVESSTNSVIVGPSSPEEASQTELALPEAEQQQRPGSLLQLLRKPRGPCWFCRICGCALREGGVAVGAAAIAIGLGNLMAMYMFLDKAKCKEAYWNRSCYENYPSSCQRGRQRMAAEEVAGPDVLMARLMLCEIVTKLYIASASIFIFVTAAAGALLLVAVVMKLPLPALMSAIAFSLALVLVILQGIPVYLLALPRFMRDIENKLEGLQDNSGDNNNNSHAALVEPGLSLAGHRALSVVGCITFVLVYVFFLAYALLVWRVNSKSKGSGSNIKDESLPE